MQNTRAKIIGLGKYLPDNELNNEYLTQFMDTSDEWIRERTGIKTRRFFTEGKDTTSSMGAAAAKSALEMAGVNAKEIDLLVFATLSPDYYFPGCGVLVQRALGMREIPCLDIRQQCSGFIYGLSVAEQYIKTGAAKKVLLICSEIQSNIMELSDRGRGVAVIFGDGAGAVVLEAAQGESGIIETQIHSDGTHAEELVLKHPGGIRKERFTKEMLDNGEHLPYMNGQLVFKNAVTRFMETIQANLTANGFKKDDIDLLITHQANLRISEFVRQKMQLPEEKVFNNIQKYGNTTAASIPIALCEAWEGGRIKAGDLICLAAFGSGFMWGSTLMKW